jgi:hypothetical protein
VGRQADEEEPDGSRCPQGGTEEADGADVTVPPAEGVEVMSTKHKSSGGNGDGYVRKNKQCGKTAESEARRMANLRHWPPAALENNNNLGAGDRSKQPHTLPGAEMSEQRVLEMIGTPEWIEQQDAVTVELLIGTVQRMDHCQRVMADPGMAFSKRHKLMLALDRFTRTAADLADSLALNPESRARLGLAVARTKAVEVTPVRTVERARKVANLLDQFGVLPPGSIEPVDADVVEDAEFSDDTPEPLPEAALADLNVRSLFDKGL